MKTSSCKAQKSYAFNKAPRCGAKTKRNNGLPCRSPAVIGKARCRIHGGSEGSGGQRGNQNALKHGFSTVDTNKIKLTLRETLKASKNLLKNY